MVMARCLYSYKKECLYFVNPVDGCWYENLDECKDAVLLRGRRKG